MSSQKSLLGPLLIALGLFIAWGLIWPDYQETIALREFVERKELELVQREETISRINRMIDEFNQRQSDIDKFSLIVPKEKSSAEIISILENMASTNGIQMTTVITNTQTNSSNNDLKYNIISLDISLDGNYISLINFLDAVERNIRLTDVISLNASLIATGSDRLGVKLIANAYFLK